MNKTFHHIGLFSREPKKLIEFYTNCLGFEQLDTKSVSKEWMVQIFGVPVECQLIKLRIDSLVIEIFASPELELVERSAPSVGYNHWGLGVEDKESFVRELGRKRVPVLKLEGTGRSIYFIKDPEGNLIEIYQR